MLKEIEKLAEKFDNDLEKIALEVRRVQSAKSRLKKQKFKATYDDEMNKILAYEQALKEARQLLDPKEKFVTDYEQADVDMLDYDETVKALKSIQSKKTNSQYLTEDLETNEVYQNACRIEKMLQAHRKTVKPVADMYIRRTDLQTVIDTIESSGQLSQEKILELLKNL